MTSAEAVNWAMGEILKTPAATPLSGYSGNAASTHKSTTCPVCRSTVIVWKQNSVKAPLLRALALASHVRAIHPRLAS